MAGVAHSISRAARSNADDGVGQRSGETAPPPSLAGPVGFQNNRIVDMGVAA
jgi:hypothetical protein